MNVSFEEFVSKWKYQGPGTGDTEVHSQLVIKPLDARSEGERWVRKYLEDTRGYKYYHDYLIEKTFEETGKLRFDFFVRKLNLLIEFDGDQHYTGSRFHPTREVWMEAINRDEMKNKFCLERGYSLIRSPQPFLRNPKKLKMLLNDRIDKLETGVVDTIHEVDWYFQWKAGKILI